jgi:hypothetical protein
VRNSRLAKSSTTFLLIDYQAKGVVARDSCRRDDALKVRVAHPRHACRSTQRINASYPFDMLRNIPAVDQPNTNPIKTQQKQMIGSHFTKGSASTLINSQASLQPFL